MKLHSTFPIILLSLAALTLPNGHLNTKNINTLDYVMLETNYKTVVTDDEVATAQKDTNSDFEKFIRKANSKIKQNEDNFSDLMKNSISKENYLNNKHADKIKYLKLSNDSFKMKLDDYIQNGTGNWKLFEADFYRGLDVLHLAFLEATISESKELSSK